MILLLLSVVFITATVSADEHIKRVETGGNEWIRIINHMPGSALFGSKSQPIHKTVVLTLARTERHADWDEAQLQNFTRTLAAAFEKDGSALSSSAITAQYITLKVFCPLTMDDDARTDDMPPLAHMAQFLEEQGFARPTVMGVNRPVARPTRVGIHVKTPQQASSGSWFGTASSEQIRLLRDRVGTRRAPFRALATEFPAPWGLDRIDQHFNGLDNSYRYNFTGQGVTAFVIDTGIYTDHTEFQGRAQFLVNTVGDGINSDCEGHGTHVSSLLGGATYGSAKGVALQAVKVLDCQGNGDLFTISSGITAAIAYKQSQPAGQGFVASLSLGGSLSTALNQAVLTLVQNGITTVVAAGNEAGDACQYSPSSLGANSPVLSIGASTSQDSRASFSNYGTCLTLFAPGYGIIGAGISGPTATLVLSGTSMATPFVGGVCAMVLQQTPTAAPQIVKDSVVAWATPQIVTQVSVGSRALLYAPINVNLQPDFVSPPPGQPTFVDSASPRQYTITTLLLLLPLVLLCLM